MICISVKTKQHFWTAKTDAAILTWIKGKGKDDLLYLDSIQLPLKLFARYIIGKHAMRTKEYHIHKEDLSEQLVTVAAVSLLEHFDPKRKKKVASYVYSVMRNHVNSLYVKSQTKKRKVDEVYIEDLRHEDSDEGETMIDFMFHQQQGSIRSNVSADQFDALVEWFEANKEQHFKPCVQAHIRFIFDIIQNPEKHNIGDQHCYSQYITKNCGITRQRLSSLLQKLQRRSRPFMDRYNKLNNP